MSGEHINGKINEDVELFDDRSRTQFIPTNLVDFFPNLKVLRSYAPLLQLTASDLKPFNEHRWRLVSTLKEDSTNFYKRQQT